LASLAVFAVLAYPPISNYRVLVLLHHQGVAIDVLQYWGGHLHGDWHNVVASQQEVNI
jgi:hypothetical protein